MEPVEQTTVQPKAEPSIKKDWSSVPRNFNHIAVNSDYSPDKEILLNDKFNELHIIKGLKTALYPHQKLTVQAMLSCEDSRSVMIGVDRQIQYSSGILSDSVGSGKTICILGLILLKKQPAQKQPDFMQLTTYPQGRGAGSNTLTSILTRRFASNLTPNLIFVGSSVMRQWVAAIDKFTDLKYLAVSGIADLEKMFKLIANGKINKYDICLVKNGKITRSIDIPFQLERDEINNVRTPYIYNMIANLHNQCWSRVIFSWVGL